MERDIKGELRQYVVSRLSDRWTRVLNRQGWKAWVVAVFMLGGKLVRARRIYRKIKAVEG